MSAPARCLVAASNAGGIPGRQRRGRAPCQDQVHLQPHYLGRQVWESFVSAIGRSVLDDEAFPLDIPKFPQPLSEAIDVGGIYHR